jgi:hypothetical protein
MKRLILPLITVALLFISSCSDNDSNTVENGINKAPNLRATGVSANDFLSDTKYQSLVVEINYVEGLNPNPQSIVNLQQFLQSRLNKSGGISIIQRQINIQSGSPFSLTEISDIENNFRTEYNETGILKLHVLFLNGSYTMDTPTGRVLGVAYRNTSCVIFESSLQELSNAINEPNRVDLETTVLCHEVCHLLGLVNLGTPMQNNHLDTEHDKHCTNPDCLMYWEIENSGVVDMMVGGNIPQLDTNCILDLQNNGGK